MVNDEYGELKDLTLEQIAKLPKANVFKKDVSLKVEKS